MHTQERNKIKRSGPPEQLDQECCALLATHNSRHMMLRFAMLQPTVAVFMNGTL